MSGYKVSVLGIFSRSTDRFRAGLQAPLCPPLPFGCLFVTFSPPTHFFFQRCHFLFGSLFFSRLELIPFTASQNGVPPELAVPGAQWLAQNGYQILGLAMVDAFVTYGYGDYREVPAVGGLSLSYGFPETNELES